MRFTRPGSGKVVETTNPAAVAILTAAGWIGEEPADVDQSVDVQAPSDPILPKRNATRAEWAAYADALGVDYPPDAKRDDIRAAIEARE